MYSKSALLILVACGALFAAAANATQSANIIRTPAAVDFRQALPEDDTGPLSLTLASQNLPEALVGESYSFDFTSLARWSGIPTGQPAPALTWSAANALPQGLVLNSQGTLSGSPQSLSSTSFEIVARYRDGEGREIYTLQVGETTFDVLAVTAGTRQTCAIVVEGHVKCWGAISRVGHAGEQIISEFPISIAGTSGATKLYAAGTHACVILRSGGVNCWGSNGQGQLGIGSSSVNYFSAAYPVVDLDGAQSLALGEAHTCAVLSGGVIKCWGHGRRVVGQNTYIHYRSPVTVTKIAGATKLAAGFAHTCGLFENGTVRCWGENNFGQLGNNSLGTSDAPVLVANINNAKDIFVYQSRSCVITTDNRVKCWGDNQYGQVGSGSDALRVITAQEVVGLSNVTDIALGQWHSCALISSGQVRCWGRGNQGRLGTASVSVNAPGAPIPGLTGVTAISAGESHTCAVKSAGGVACWGVNLVNQLGDGTRVDRTAPVNVKPN